MTTSERGAAGSEAKKCVAVLSNDHILVFGEVFETSLPPTLSAYALPSFSYCSHFIACGRTSQKHVPYLLTVVVKRLLDAREAYTANMY